MDNHMNKYIYFTLTLQIFWVKSNWNNSDGTWRHDVNAIWYELIYRQVSNIRRTLQGNKIVDHSDVVGASPVGAAPTTSSFST